jgi:membrane protein YqaA with SNARE-associated domain
MASSLTTTDELAHHGGHDGISVVRWFAFYAVMLAMVGAWLGILLLGPAAGSFDSWAQFKSSPPEVKLLTFGIYISFCCTFLFLPANWIVAVVATRTLAVGTGLWDTVLLVGLVGATASTIANLNDYHLFTWMLRHHRVAKVRHTRIYKIAARWFDKSPFFLVAVFNILPIPVDVVRMLAATHRYPRVPFAAANFVGRLIRYGAIAYLVYYFELSVTAATMIMLGLAVAMLLAKSLPRLWAAEKSPEASCE